MAIDAIIPRESSVHPRRATIDPREAKDDAEKAIVSDDDELLIVPSVIDLALDECDHYCC
jgi:hypothetical protein